MSKVMPYGLDRARSRAERACTPSPADWIRCAPSQPGLERIEAHFTGHAYDTHRHDTYALGYTICGAHSFDYRGAQVKSIKGNVIVLYPDERHDGQAASEEGFRYRMLYLEPRLIRDATADWTRALPFAREPVLRSSRLVAVLRSGLEDLDRCMEPLEADRLVLGVAEALRALDSSAKTKLDSSPCRFAVERAREFLDAHHDRTVRSEELEAATGLDRYSLARHFRQLIGTSPYRYLVMRRLDRVRSMMRRGHSIVDAALACGFADQSHMTRQFKSTYGIAPGAWRSICIAN